MATRFYLPSSGAAAVSPAFGALWDETGSADRLAMSTTPADTANGSKGVAETVSATADYLIRQYVGPDNLAAGTVAGTFRVAIPAEESNLDMNSWLQARVAIVSGDGATERAEIYSGQSQGGPSASSSDPNFEFDGTPQRDVRILEVSLTPGVAQAGDRLVVELGYRFSNTGTSSRTATLHFGDQNVDTDYAFVADTTFSAGSRPWVEFDFISTVDPPAMAATAEFLAPAIVTDISAEVSAAAMTATAQFLAPNQAGGVPSRTTVQHDRLPLTVRVGDRHITREVSALSFRKEATGGLRSISLRLSRPLDRFDPNLAALSKVYVFDGRSGGTVAEGRLSDFGRSAGADGQQWDLVAFGPAQHATDLTFPYIVADTRLDAWRRSQYSTKNAATQNDERGEDTPTLLVAAEEDKTVTTSWVGSWIYRAIRQAGMKLARVRCDWDAGVTDADYALQIHTRAGSGGSSGAADSDTASTTPGTLAQVVTGSNFANGDDVADLRAVRNGSGTTGTEDHWFEFWDVSCRALLLDKDGSEITSGYTLSTVLAHEIVKDLLGRVLTQFDGTNATVATSGTYAIDQFAYPDGVTAEQVLNDLAILEPAYVWYAKEDVTGDGYQFFYQALPTTVRYEVTLDDGGSFPTSTQEMFNKVTVRWTDKDGRPRTTTRTSTIDSFDNATPPIVRSTIIDLGDEIGSTTAAQRAGDNFLAEHNVPKNAGTLNISRPIRDLTLGRMVMPFEIEPRELIRVRGVESNPDALNADSNDGQTVFRIWANTYTSDTNTAALELDTDARNTTNALAKLAKRRNRKR